MSDNAAHGGLYRKAMLAAALALAVLGAAALAVAGAAAADDPAARQAPPTPSSLDFTAQPGTVSERKLVTLTNTERSPQRLVAFGLTGTHASQFTIDTSVQNGCRVAMTLPRNGSCVVGVTYRPTSAGQHTATLRFVMDEGQPQDVRLTGTATVPPPPPPSPPPPPPAPAPPPAPPPPPPDPDADGVSPGADRCPGVAGELRNGCPRDGDRDGVIDRADACPAVAGNLKDGCPAELNADVRGQWRVNALYSQLMMLVVRSLPGSRIELRCSARRACGFTKRIVRKTTKRLTYLTRTFKGSRILPANVVITVRVTRPQYIGSYERLVTRKGRRLPKVTQRCLAADTGAVQRCA